FPLASAHNTQAVILFLCTSKPQQQVIDNFHRATPFTARRRTLRKSENLLRVLSATSGGYNSLCFSASQPYSYAGSASARVARPLSPTRCTNATPSRAHFHPSLWAPGDHDLLVHPRQSCDIQFT